ncbi:MAG: ABC transporter ATP-binding protein, partial [Acidobacteria bacterium]
MVRACGISKYFGGVRALDNVSLNLFPAEIVGIVGDNGAGKSTFVKVLSGIHQPDQGTLWLSDCKVHHLTPRRAREAGIQTVYQQLL